MTKPVLIRLFPSFSPLKLALFGTCLFLSHAGWSEEQPINIGERRQLFVDDHLLARRSGVDLMLHSPVPREVVLIRNAPWEGNDCGYETLFRDGDMVRLYYIATDLTTTIGPDEAPAQENATHPMFHAAVDRTSFLCYAESKDGIHWTKPNLGLVEFNGSKANNILLAAVGDFTPFKDLNPDCRPDERYKAVSAAVDPTDATKGKNVVLFAYKSADGLHWSRLQEAPILTKGKFDTQNNAFWDAPSRLYRCYIRDFHDNIRDIRLSTSSDFHAWTEPMLIQFDGAPEEQLYTNQIMRYGRAPDLLLGFPTRYVERKFSPAALEALPNPEFRKRRMKSSERYGTAITDGLFMVSHDGLLFHRWDETFIPPRPQRRDNWVYGDGYQSLGLIETPAEDPTAEPELSLYVTEGTWKEPTPLRRYTLRIDGFVSLHARQKTGEVLTKPLIFTGRRMSVNFGTSAAGAVMVELQAADGTPLPGFTLADCDEMFGNSLDRTVTWHEQSDVSGCIGKPVRIHLVLREADLYSLRFLE